MDIENKLREILCGECGNSCSDCKNFTGENIAAILALFPKPKRITAEELFNLFLGSEVEDEIECELTSKSNLFSDVADKINAYFGAGEGKCGKMASYTPLA